MDRKAQFCSCHLCPCDMESNDKLASVLNYEQFQAYNTRTSTISPKMPTDGIVAGISIKHNGWSKKQSHYVHLKRD